MITKFYTRKQLYVAAGVSRTTFYRWLLEDQEVLRAMGIMPYHQFFHPHAVEYICQRHGIDPAKLPK